MAYSPYSTTVEEVHEILCDSAVRIANDLATNDMRIPKRYRGPVFRNGSPYNQGRLVLEITEEYYTASARTKKIYRALAQQAIRAAIFKNKELFAGLILGEARAGRNYFDRWDQAPTVLFD